MLFVRSTKVIYSFAYSATNVIVLNYRAVECSVEEKNIFDHYKQKRFAGPFNYDSWTSAFYGCE